MRFRMNSEMRGARYWETEERRVCKLCGEGEEIWEHVLGECMGEEEGGNWWQSLREILGQEGEGERWLRELEGKREKKEGVGQGGEEAGGRVEECE